MPASRALPVLPCKPAPRPPAPSYLKETERKVLLLRRPSGRGARGSPTESRRPAQPPRASEKLLVGVFRVQVVGPPAARRAARPHSASGGRAPRRPRRPEAASRGAGRTVERGAGPAGAPRPRRQRLPRRPPEAGGLIRPQASPPSRRRGPQVSFRPPGGHGRSRPSAPLAAGLCARARSAQSGGWAAGGSGEARLCQPGSARFLQGASVPALSGAAVRLVYTPLHTLSLPATPPLPTSESENLSPSAVFWFGFVFLNGSRRERALLTGDK